MCRLGESFDVSSHSPSQNWSASNMSVAWRHQYAYFTFAPMPFASLGFCFWPSLGKQLPMSCLEAPFMRSLARQAASREHLLLGLQFSSVLDRQEAKRWSVSQMHSID